MVITINPYSIVMVFLKILLGVVILAFASSLVVMPLVNTDENKEQGVRSITILKKTNDGYARKFKVEDMETGNKFTVTPTKTWYDSMEVGSVTATTASLNDTRVLLMAWITISFIIDLVVLGFLFIWFLGELPGMIKNLEGVEFKLDLRSKKTKQRELTILELEKTPEFKAWRKDYEEALLAVDK